MECDSKKGGAGPGSDNPDVAVFKQLAERVRALEESLKKMEEEEEEDEGGKDSVGASGGAHKGSGVHSNAVVRRKKGVPSSYTFQMPMHYPRYCKADYEVMPEWRLDRLLQEYGLPLNVAPTLAEKRLYAMGVFLWADQRDSS